jgi:hypothetical protein
MTQSILDDTFIRRHLVGHNRHSTKAMVLYTFVNRSLASIVATMSVSFLDGAGTLGSIMEPTYIINLFPGNICSNYKAAVKQWTLFHDGNCFTMNCVSRWTVSHDGLCSTMDKQRTLFHDGQTKDGLCSIMDFVP